MQLNPYAPSTCFHRHIMSRPLFIFLFSKFARLAPLKLVSTRKERPMNRFFRFGAAALLSAALSSASLIFGQSLTFARIAGWNQQGVEFDNQGTVHPVHKPDQLRAAIAAMNADIIVMSEVNSKESMEEIVATPFP